MKTLYTLIPVVIFTAVLVTGNVHARCDSEFMSQRSGDHVILDACSNLLWRWTRPGEGNSSLYSGSLPYINLDTLVVIEEWTVSERGPIFEGDLNRNGKREIVYSGWGGSVYVYEVVNDDSFSLAYTAPCPQNPVGIGTVLLAVGDTDSDGLMEMVFGSGTSGVPRDLIIYEQSDSTGYPDTEVVRIPEVNIGVNHMRIADMDGDSQMDIIGTTQGTHQVSLAVWEYKGEGNYEQVYWNDFGGPSWVSGEPSIGDFDVDGMEEIILPVDQYPFPRVFVIENTGDDSYVETWDAQLPAENAYWSTPGPDLDRDGWGDFVITCATGWGEANWYYVMYEATDDNTYQQVWQYVVSGSFINGGSTTGDINGDLKNELLCQNWSESYLFKMVADDSLELVWQTAYGCIGQGEHRLITGDVDADNKGELAYYPEETDFLRLYEQLGPPIQAAVMLHPHRVRVSPGDEVTYDVMIKSNSDTTLSLHGALRVSTPWGSSFWKLPPIPFTLSPMQMVMLSLTDQVPPGAPAGDYTLRAFIGYPEEGVIDWDSFRLRITPLIFLSGRVR
ncbi:MAG: FG-GAP-like repeat-containing protein [Candidatus Glassbacteria bacterium]